MSGLPCLVEAGQGVAIIPSFGLPMARQRKVAVTQLVSPTVQLDFHQISNRAKPLPDDAVEFTGFVKSYASRWAGRSGVV